MAIVDERGRLFGRWNLLDFALVVMIAGLIPLGFAAYALFRDQPPRITSISPASLQQTPEFRLTIKGENFRPYMRASIDLYQGRDFVFRSPEEAEVPFIGMPPGQYDVILYDQAQERFRLPKAFTVTSSALPATELIAVGAFGNLDAAGAAKLTAGLQLPGVGQIVAVGKPTPDLTQVFSGSKVIAVPIPNALRLPAIVKFACYVRTQQGTPFCVSEDVTIAPNALFVMPTPLGKTPFQVQRVRSSAPLEPLRMSVRVQAAPAVIARIKAGDIDNGGIANEFATLARIDSVNASGGTAEITLTAQAQHVDGGWLYDSAPLRAGAPLTLRTIGYEVSGIVTEISTKQ